MKRKANFVKNVPVDEETFVRKVPADQERFSVNGVENVSETSKEEVNEIRATPGWETSRVQVDSGAFDAVGPKEIARARETKQTIVSGRGVGYVAASGSSAKNYGEEEIVGLTDDGEGVSGRIPRADVKKVLCSAHEMNL